MLTTGQPVWVRDVTADPAFLRRAADAEVRGAFAFPVEVGGVVAAVLEFLSRDAVDPDPALIELSRRIGALLGRVIERERIEEQIHFQARMLDSVGQAVIASDAHHRVIYWNRAAEDLFGWPATEAIGRIDSELLPARVTPQQTADITARLAAGQSWTGEYEIFEFDLGSTFNYAEMAALIAPRPFMVERGHFDGVGVDERVAAEYAKVQRIYNVQLKMPDRCQIEYFVGPHKINGVGTFDFLHKHLNWPKP